MGERCSMDLSRRGPSIIDLAHHDIGDIIEHDALRVLEEHEFFKERHEEGIQGPCGDGDIVLHDARDDILTAYDMEESACGIRKESPEIWGFDLEADVCGVFEDPVGHRPPRGWTP